MYTMFCDLTQKRIFWRIKGSMDQSDFQTLLQELKRNTERMGSGSGFTMLIDLSEAAPFDPERHDDFHGVLNFCREKGMRKSASILYNQEWLQAMRFGAEKSGLTTVEGYFSTKLEAEKFFAS